MTPASPSVATSIRTPRLWLRPWSHGDAAAVRKALDRSADHLRPWVPFMKDEPRTLEETATWLERRREWFESGENFPYAMLLAEDESLVGEMTLMQRGFPREFEIGYWVDVAHARNGFASEGTAALARLAFEFLGAELVEIHLAAGNEASRGVPERLGFSHECTRRQRYVDCTGDRHDLEAYVLFERDFWNGPCAHASIEALDAGGKRLRAQK
jgi:RimJ/RimL family protein N-acetyltransferase